MEKLKQKVIYEFVIIFLCMFLIIEFVVCFIVPNVYLSNFILSTIEAIIAGVILMFMFPLYFRDLKKLEKLFTLIYVRNVSKPFLRYCIIISVIIGSISLTAFMILWILVLILNLTAIILNVIANILGVIMIISFVIGVCASIIRELDMRAKEIKS